MAILQRISNVLFIWVLCAVLMAAYGYQIIKQEEPCPLCLLQRLGMIATAAALLMNLRFGIKMEHYGLAILSSFMGRIVSLRQIGLHVCPEFPTFGEPVLGFDLYVWSFIVFSCSIFACAVLLILKGYSKPRDYLPTWGPIERFTFWLVALITLGNIIVSLKDCGLSTC